MKNKGERRKSDTSSIKSAIEDMLKSYRIKDKFDENKLIANWEQIMGTPIARRTEKVYIKNKVLYAKITSSALRHELTIARQKVLDVIYEHVEKDLIKDVRFI